MNRILRATAVSLAVLAGGGLIADEPASADASAEESRGDPALQAEVDYVEALVGNGFADFAAPVIEATKKKRPESEPMLFAIEVDGLLALGKFDDANAKIAALPDRNGLKYWAARLKVANYHYQRGNRKECEAIYGEFFKKYPNAPEGLGKFYREACYTWGRLLYASQRYEESARINEKILAMLDKSRKTSDDDAFAWMNVACETAELYLHLATGKEKPADRKKYLDPAKKLVDQLLWDDGVFLGRAVAMKANIELLKGDVARAQATIDDYYAGLQKMHEALAERDPEGKLGVLKQSPMPICRFMLAKMLWQEAQAEYKKPNRDDEKVKSLLFGKRDKKGKRNNKGAFNHSLNVFVQYPWSSWASQAGEMNEAIRQFAEKNYGAKIKKNVTADMMEADE